MYQFNLISYTDFERWSANVIGAPHRYWLTDASIRLYRTDHYPFSSYIHNLIIIISKTLFLSSYIKWCIRSIFFVFNSVYLLSILSLTYFQKLIFIKSKSTAQHFKQWRAKLPKKKRKTKKGSYFEELAVSSSSQWRICLTLRLKMDADCFTSLLRRRTTALTPATVIMKFVNPITPLRTLIHEHHCSVVAKGFSVFLGRKKVIFLVPKENFCFCFCFLQEKRNCFPYAKRKLIQYFNISCDFEPITK